MTLAVKVALNPNTTNQLNYLPKDTILDLSNLKAFVDEKMNVTETLKFVWRWVVNIVRKGENAGYQHFFAFSTMFSRDLFLRVIYKSGLCGKRLRTFTLILTNSLNLKVALF